jgi:hypothetical protein
LGKALQLLENSEYRKHGSRLSAGNAAKVFAAIRAFPIFPRARKPGPIYPPLLLPQGGPQLRWGSIQHYPPSPTALCAAGAPGGDLDEACARAGLDKIKDQLK